MLQATRCLEPRFERPLGPAPPGKRKVQPHWRRDKIYYSAGQKWTSGTWQGGPAGYAVGHQVGGCSALGCTC